MLVRLSMLSNAHLLHNVYICTPSRSEEENVVAYR